jgi:hypothetical protein
MKKLFYLSIALLVILGCSKDESEQNYLTSIDSIKAVMVGSWENSTYAQRVLKYTVDSVYLYESGVLTLKGTWRVTQYENIYYLWGIADYGEFIKLSNSQYTVEFELIPGRPFLNTYNRIR